MADEETSALAPPPPERKAPIPFKQFLEAVHPSISKKVSGLWSTPFDPSLSRSRGVPFLVTPDLRLHCQRCDGERMFRRKGQPPPSLSAESANERVINYLCGDCREQVKSFALLIAVGKSNEGVVYKYGELPPFGVPVPNKLLRLFGKDGATFLKGRQCENQGLGIGAFAYYRRVVENHKNELFEEIIKVCETVPGSEQLIEELRSAQKEVSFTKAMERIKTELPQGLLINGQNPLLALHGALSIGLHNESDETCLETAHAVRLVLTGLVEGMSFLRQDKSELQSAVQRLIAKKDGA